MKKEKLLKAIAGIIAALFVYAAISKLIDFDKSRAEMHNQVFPKAIADILLWVVPFTELFLATLLLFSSTRLKALYASAMLLSAFTVYIAVTMTGIFGRVPCSCANIISHQTTYGEQLIFNICFIALTITGLTIEKGWLKNVDNLFHPNRKELAQS